MIELYAVGPLFEQFHENHLLVVESRFGAAVTIGVSVVTNLAQRAATIDLFLKCAFLLLRKMVKWEMSAKTFWHVTRSDAKRKQQPVVRTSGWAMNFSTV